MNNKTMLITILLVGFAQAQNPWTTTSKTDAMTGKVQVTATSPATDWSGDELSRPKLVARNFGGGFTGRGCVLYLDVPFTILDAGARMKFDGKLKRVATSLAEDKTAIFLGNQFKELTKTKVVIVQYTPAEQVTQSVSFNVDPFPTELASCK